MNEKAVVVRIKPELTEVGKRRVSTVGWRVHLVLEHLQLHLSKEESKRWCAVECMAKTMFQKNTGTNREAVRRRMAWTFRELLKLNRFLVIEYSNDPARHRQIVACKLYEDNEKREQASAQFQLERMKARRQLNEETWLRAMELIGCAIGCAR